MITKRDFILSAVIFVRSVVALKGHGLGYCLGSGYRLAVRVLGQGRVWFRVCRNIVRESLGNV